MSETVILVPGIGLGGSELLVLFWRLRKHGYRVRIFWKNPWRRALRVSAKALHQMLNEEPTVTAHIVAHSLGGLVTMQMLRDYPQQKVGRVIMLGTPISGCLAARRVLRIPGGRWLLGGALASTCAELPFPFPVDCEAGGIAGRFNLLLGLVLCPHKPNDTLVCVEETQHPDLSAHCVFVVSHTSMLLSRQVNERIVSFLRSGIFSSAANSI